MDHVQSGVGMDLPDDFQTSDIVGFTKFIREISIMKNVLNMNDIDINQQNWKLLHANLSACNRQMVVEIGKW